MDTPQTQGRLGKCVCPLPSPLLSHFPWKSLIPPVSLLTHPPPQIGAQNSGTQPTLPAYIFFSWHLQVNQLELTKSTYQL